MSDQWVVVDRNHKVWFPYIYTPRDENLAPELLLHHEEADTDMGDLAMPELVEVLSPVRVVLYDDVKRVRAEAELKRAQAEYDEAVARSPERIKKLREELNAEGR
ncbi:hypothetical protein BJD55_gp158 [Gordonia phage Yvonnetastic]|uniref:Uncharacterized protein n=1 Tax=Gordonia phage Yvonnetastic TaxID=1821566 RepID=A0A142K925_9CAUD|nr:hypothetical protein BJD55_gp158 [Gordonia phage Yvonnetastic]AMS02608.1 hypothetical protein SEA_YVONNETASTIC_64 [Gordonia phage Yvonnetastic]WKW86040.1 hypothetical protein SEA_JONJAMES_66 [Gordonia Phage JonJames]